MGIETEGLLTVARRSQCARKYLFSLAQR